MLRRVLFSAGLVSLAASAYFALSGQYPEALWLLLNGVMLSAGTVFERWRYGKTSHTPPINWQRTGERFLDPHSGQLTDVYYNPATGERRYVSSRR